LIGEMLVELGLLDEKRELLAAAASKTELGHDAKAAVGQAPEGAEEGDVTIEPEDESSDPGPPDGPATQEAPPQPEPAAQPTVVE
jgi:hypothetical protein